MFEVQDMIRIEIGIQNVVLKPTVPMRSWTSLEERWLAHYYFRSRREMTYMAPYWTGNSVCIAPSLTMDINTSVVLAPEAYSNYF
jgi:hypothetical protein